MPRRGAAQRPVLRPECKAGLVQIAFNWAALLDGDDVGSIEPHQTIELPVEAGHHELQVKTGRYTSRRDTFDTNDGEIVTFRCYGGRIPALIASMVKPDMALTLKRE